MDLEQSENLRNWLRKFAHDSSAESAFGQVVNHLSSLVYQAAYRQSGDSGLAEDITQSVFLIVARKAGMLAKHPTILGWVHQTTRLETLRAMKSQRRRKKREEAAMEELGKSAETNHEFLEILDESMKCLSSSERELVLMKYFEDRSYKSITRQTGRSESAEKMRLKRALEKMSRWFGRKGVTLSITGLATLLGTEMAKGAPLKLVKSVTFSAASTSSGVIPSLFVMNSTKLAVGTGLLVMAAGWVPLQAAWQKVRDLESRKAKIENATSQNSSRRPMSVGQESSDEVATVIDSLTNIPKDRYSNEELLTRLINAVSSHSGAMIDRGSTKPDLHRLDMILEQMDESELRELIAALCKMRGRSGQHLSVHQRLLSYLPKDWSAQQKIEWALSSGAEAEASKNLFSKWVRKDAAQAGRWLRAHTQSNSFITKGSRNHAEQRFWETWIRFQIDRNKGAGVVETLTSLTREQRERMGRKIPRVVIKFCDASALGIQMIRGLHDPSELIWLSELQFARKAPRRRAEYGQWLEENGLSEFEQSRAMNYFKERASR